MTDLTWEQKLEALQALASHYDVALKMRRPGDWYVSTSMSVGGDAVLTGLYGNGESPEEAVNNHWQIYAEDLPRDRYIHVGCGEEVRRARWNGFMWLILTEDEVASIRKRNQGGVK